MTLPQPEDGPLAHRLRNFLPLRVGAQRLLGVRTVVLGQGEHCPLLDLLVVGEPENRIQSPDRPLGADLRQPEYGLAAHFRIRVASNRLQQDVLGSGSFCWATRKTAFRRMQAVAVSRFARTRRKMGRARAASICCRAFNAATFMS